MGYDVVALGELLIDFTPGAVSDQGNPTFEANPGGAPCNVLSMLGRFGHKTAFIGKVGEDMFGRMLADAITECGISAEGLRFDPDVNTTLAFVQKLPNGDRDFSFYRKPGADMMLRAEEVNEEMIKASRIFHFGTLSMTHDTVREATKKALDIAKTNGVTISFDPNLRESLWDTLENAKKQVEYGLHFCDVLKISDNEIQWFTGEEDYDKGIQILKDTYHIPLILLSLGKDGSRAYYGDKCVEVAGFVREDTVETTGAGDTFFGSCLHFVLEKGLDNLQEADLKEMLTFANAAASIITTRKGALMVMPAKEEVEAMIK